MLAGVAECIQAARNPQAFVAICVAAGTMGDLLCYGFGRWYAESAAHVPPQFRAGKTMRSRLTSASAFIDRSPRCWLILCRLFPAVNQFVPFAAGVRGLGMAEVGTCCLAGNVFWLGGLGLVGSRFGELLKAQYGYVWTTLAVFGGLLLYLALRWAGKSVGGSSR